MLSKIGEDEDAVHRAVTRTVSGVIARTAPSLVARTVSLTYNKELGGSRRWRCTVHCTLVAISAVS